MENKGKYYLGLDMGTSSVGWAVTDQHYQLLRAKGKDLWGVRLFDEAKTAAERRSFRVSRRRRQREVARLGMLREYFAEEIAKKDAGFFARLDDSKFHMQERAESNRQPFALFADSGYTDREYYKEYPTIFHLRKELICSKESHDVRLVYLALANMFKHRGHFLNASLGSEEKENNFQELCEMLVEKAAALDISFSMTVNPDILAQKLGEKGVSRLRMLENVSELLGIQKKQKKAYQIIKLMCGLDVKVIDLLGEGMIDEGHSKLSISFRAANYEEMAGEVQSVIGEDCFELIRIIKDIHDSGLLSNIMKGHKYLSEARVELYEDHQKDLMQLKTVLKKYDQKAYHDMFRVMKAGNYSAYVGSVNSSDEVVRRTGKGRSQEELYKNIRNILKKFPQEDPDIVDILKKMDAEVFLPKQLTVSNGVIPNQVHEMEMRAILKNAENYLPFLGQKDESGLTVSQRILALFTFQIPYYVGPIGPANRDNMDYHGWAIRKTSGRIYPWTIEHIVDMKGTAAEFIERMVRHCSYLTGERALPKQSLLYERYEVLNELNNLKINGEKPPVEVKQAIYKGLFEKGKKVSINQLVNFLIVNGYLDPNEADAISGIDGGFHSSLSSLGKFRAILGDAVFSDENRKMIEDIIFWGTIYGNDKRFWKESIHEKYGQILSEKDIKRILGFKFDGWGKLSEEFLNMEGVSKEDGVIRRIIVSLWETNDNLMQLLSDRYTYLNTLTSLVQKMEKPLSEWTIEDLDSMYLSAPVKRMVWQTISVLEELEHVLGCAPERIFVEVAREKGEKGERKDSRKQRLLGLYNSIKNEERDWRQEIEDKPDQEFRSKKLYLYYLQMGKCMYTGDEIDFDELMKDNLYDIDHIYPRHFVKDDSIENNLVLVRKKQNLHKSDHFPIEPGVYKKMQKTWKELADKGFISKEKYNRLTRKTNFTEEEKAAFISRQLVETRQGTKAITQILSQVFPKTEIIFSKAGNVSEFRHKYKLYKVRCVNDFHHAMDAYLNIVVGNTYFVKFTKDPRNFIREAEKNPKKDIYKYNMDRIFDWNVERNGEVAWIAPEKDQAGTIQTVRRVMAKNSPLVTRMCGEAHGSISQKTTIWSAKTANEENYIPVKMGDPRLQDVTRYGGVTAVAVAGYALVEYKMMGKAVRSLEALPIYLGRVDSLTEDMICEYLTMVISRENRGTEITDVSVRIKLIPQNSLVRYDGFYYYLAGKTGKNIIVCGAVQACFSPAEMAYIKKLEKAGLEKSYDEVDRNKNKVLSKKQNQELFHRIVEKYSSSIYKNKRGAVGNILSQGEEKFQGLELKEQCDVLLELLRNFQFGREVDLTLIGGAKRSGASTIGKKISAARECVLIHQSPTGLFRTEIDLLKV